jgi:hypothetical protein
VPIHVNATNVVKMIPPQGGSSVVDVMQRNVDAVLSQRDSTGQPMIPHINHPNFGWALTAEDIAAVEGERFFEVYNGHPATHNDGDSTRASTDDMWDQILIDRLGRGSDVIYGIAVDDAHHYHGWAPNLSNPGRGWIFVRSSQLSADSLITAMERGDFYASTGVTLDDIRVTEESLEIDIATQDGVAYRTEFVGLRRPASAEIDPMAETSESATRESAQILDVVEGGAARYTFAGDELYVRARIISDRIKANGVHDGELERAWTQPVVL